MPYKSKAQARMFHYMESKGKMPKKTVHEFDDATDFEHLPEKMAHGGMVDDDGDDFDYEEGHESEYDSSGEPHTEHEPEDEHPMEFMSRGGMVKKRMAMGGRVPKPDFVHALKKSRY